MLNRSNQVANMLSPAELVKESQLFDDSIPAMLNIGSRSQNRKQSGKSIEDMFDDSSSRKEQHIIIYFLNLVLSFCISFQNIIFVFTNDQVTKGYMSITIALSTIFITVVTTSLLCKDKWKIFNLYILLDNIFLTQVASSFGFIGFLLVIYYGYWYQLIAMIAFPIEIIFFVGNFRILMLHVNWSKWRIILFKLVLLADSAVFFQIGAYYMSVNFEYTNGKDSILDGQVKDFVLLYIFGLFALFVQLYSKMSDIDQTSELKFDYQFKEMEEEKKIQRIRKSVRRSVLGLNTDNQKVQVGRSRFMNEVKKKSYLQVQQISQN